LEPLTIIAAVLIAIVGVGRLGRVIIYDSFPPSVWLRIKWDNLTYDQSTGEASKWNLLLHCPWCLLPWLMAICVGWFFLGLQFEWAAWAWWLFWGWLALSYLSSMLYVRDERP
jgi:hypothetical protein